MERPTKDLADQQKKSKDNRRQNIKLNNQNQDQKQKFQIANSHQKNLPDGNRDELEIVKRLTDKEINVLQELMIWKVKFIVFKRKTRV